jgi:hypothetical protein
MWTHTHLTHGHTHLTQVTHAPNTRTHAPNTTTHAPNTTTHAPNTIHTHLTQGTTRTPTPRLMVLHMSGAWSRVHELVNRGTLRHFWVLESLASLGSVPDSMGDKLAGLLRLSLGQDGVRT